MQGLCALPCSPGRGYFLLECYGAHKGGASEMD